ncbi:MAG: DegV family protein [Thermoleophilia bacterium]|nr:DegV family protein [Thermoleophilia bacterium]
MPDIALVIDSTCDLSEDARQKYVTAMVPLHVQVGGVSYLDRVDLDPRGFYKLFREAGQEAQSSQPSVGEFANVYSNLLEHHDAVVSIHISARLSGAVQSATLAAETVDPARVLVIDSQKVSMGVGLVVQAAGEAIAAGEDLAGVAAAARAVARDTRVYGTLQSLEVAVKGGRVSAHAARLAKMTDLKPLIIFDDEGGAHTDGARIGFARAIRAVAERVVRYAPDGAVRIAIAHADGHDDALYLRDRLRTSFGDLDIPVLEAGAVITTHVGLGTIAVAVQRRTAPDTTPGDGQG